jgi:hypothetical protein
MREEVAGDEKAGDYLVTALSTETMAVIQTVDEEDYLQPRELWNRGFDEKERRQ